MSWNIILFESSRGDKPVEMVITSLDQSTIAKTAHIIDLLENYGHQLGMPHSKKLTPDVYELRIRGRQEVRILYSFVKKDIYLLHAFIKKQQKTPKKEIETALTRLRSLT